MKVWTCLFFIFHAGLLAQFFHLNYSDLNTMAWSKTNEPPLKLICMLDSLSAIWIWRRTCPLSSTSAPNHFTTC
jgi:hypothetical protein